MLETQSPTSINTWIKSPRLYYYRYIKRIPLEPNIHLYKGTLVHEAIEEAFKNTHYIDLKAFLKKYITDKWNPLEYDVLITNKDSAKHKREAIQMVEIFGDSFNKKIKLAESEAKIKDKNHAWNIFRPKFSEHNIQNPTLKLKGIIDAVNVDYDGRIFIIDYKTSKKHKDIIPEDYIRQLSLYALLYKEKEGKMPNFVGLNYLRYGETILLPVTEQMIQTARDVVKMVQEKTKSENIEDYPIGTDKYAIDEVKEIEAKIK